jgi:hypothetical protein
MATKRRCGLSRLNELLALWSQAHMPSCNRQAKSTSIHRARPGSANLALLAVTHRYNRTHLSLARIISDRRFCARTTGELVVAIRAPIVQFCGFRRARWPGDRHGVVGAALFIFVVVSEESPDYVVSQVRDAWRIYNACTPEIGFDTVGKAHPAAEQYGHLVMAVFTSQVGPGVQLRRTGHPLTGDPRLGRAKDAGGYRGPVMC